jgi:hypothetical protein
MQIHTTDIIFVISVNFGIEIPKLSFNNDFSFIWFHGHNIIKDPNIKPIIN